MRSASGVTDLHSNHLGSAVARQSQTGHGLNVNDFQQYSAGVVEGMGSLGAGVTNAVKGETLQTAARGLEVLISDPGSAAATVGQAAIDQGQALMQTAAAVASDPGAAAAALNDNPRALGRVLGQAAGDLAVAKIAKDARGGGEGGGAQYALNSFAPDTPVLTADGAQAIGTLNVGDVVIAYDTASGTVSRVPITHVWVHRDAVLVDLWIDGTLIETTPAHPFFTAEAGWVDAGALWAGAHIRTVAGTAGVVQQITLVARTQVLYNLTVATAHTFFVGRAGWLVHNACPKAILKKLREPGTFNPTASSKQEALEWAQEAFPDAVHLPDAQPNTPYPSTAGYDKWYRFEPAEPDVGNNLPHIKYADWTGGKKNRGGSWGHIFYPDE